MGALNGDTFGIFTSGQSLFWDGSETDLQNLVLKPITHRIEMGMRSPQDLVDKLRTVSYYEELFNNAYGSPEITVDKISEALAGFVGSIESNKSKFDVNLNTLENSFSEMEMRGQDLFFGDYDCGSCHQLQLPFGYDPTTAAFGEMVNIGLDLQTTDPGFADVTGSPQDHGKFKIPNLRNVELTAPYMHDGRFETLGEVIDHYSSGVVNSSTLDPRLMQNGQPEVLNIPSEDKAALIAFLKTLTDYDMVTDPKYSNPFQEQ
jgi:cytochrome c peroxidase